MDREKKNVTRHGPTTDMKPSHYFAKENENIIATKSIYKDCH
jgi:hypothetical protein